MNKAHWNPPPLCFPFPTPLHKVVKPLLWADSFIEIHSTFAGKHLDNLSDSLLDQYDKLINQPSNDWEIYYWMTEKKPTPEEYDNEVMDMLKIHAKNKAMEERIRQPDLQEKWTIRNMAGSLNLVSHTDFSCGSSHKLDWLFKCGSGILDSLQNITPFLRR